MLNMVINHQSVGDRNPSVNKNYDKHDNESAWRVNDLCSRIAILTMTGILDHLSMFFTSK